MNPLATVRSSLRGAVLKSATTLRLDAMARMVDRRVGVRVMNLHGTPSHDRERFDAHLRWVAAHFEVLRPETFIAIAEGRERRPSRPAVLFTFDDGLRSNLTVAAEVLEAHGMRGLFFVNPAFCMLAADEAQQFFRTRIRPDTTPGSLDPELFTPLSPQDVTALHNRGHRIGSHTNSHCDLGTASHDTVVRELDDAQRSIEAWTQRPCDTFAWTFAWNRITADAWTEIRRRHRYCFSACPGVNAWNSMDPHLVFRTNVESSQAPFEYRFFYSGLADVVWTRRREQLQRLVRGR